MTFFPRHGAPAPAAIVSDATAGAIRTVLLLPGSSAGAAYRMERGWDVMVHNGRYALRRIDD